MSDAEEIRFCDEGGRHHTVPVIIRKEDRPDTLNCTRCGLEFQKVWANEAEDWPQGYKPVTESDDGSAST